MTYHLVLTAIHKEVQMISMYKWTLKALWPSACKGLEQKSAEKVLNGPEDLVSYPDFFQIEQEHTCSPNMRECYGGIKEKKKIPQMKGPGPRQRINAVFSYPGIGVRIKNIYWLQLDTISDLNIYRKGTTQVLVLNTNWYTHLKERALSVNSQWVNLLKPQNHQN